MAHLAALRIGWENEHLATFLLSRISFVANPVTVADDIGSDFFCTLFEASTQSGTEQLFPRNSFAIQVKSSEAAFQATNKIDYLEKLELPFFVGVVDRTHQRLRIYSGEYLPILLCQHGKPRKLRLSPAPATEVAAKGYCKVKTGKNLVLLHALLRLPFVMEISAKERRDSILDKAKQLSELCFQMHQNISTKVRQEYIFKVGHPSRDLIMAGSGSVQTFRRNFCLRLAEAFFNLKWLYDGQRHNFKMEEFMIYEKCYLELAKTGIQIPKELKTIYDRFKRQLVNEK